MRGCLSTDMEIVYPIEMYLRPGIPSPNNQSNNRLKVIQIQPQYNNIIRSSSFGMVGRKTCYRRRRNRRSIQMSNLRIRRRLFLAHSKTHRTSNKTTTFFISTMYLLINPVIPYAVTDHSLSLKYFYHTIPKSNQPKIQEYILVH